MTYRRLFFMLLAGSTMLLAVVWWQSFQSVWLLTAGNRRPPFTLFAGLARTNISLSLDSYPQPGWGHQFTSIPLVAGKPLDGFTPVYLEPSGLFGSFRWLCDSGHVAGGIVHALYMVFPVWVPWLFFVGGAFAFCRVMEKRAGGRKEKELAEGQAAGKLGRETDSSMAVAQSMEGRSPNRREHEK